MSSGTIDYFEGIDGSRAAEALVTSILINGRGRYFDPRSNESSTSPFERLFLDRSTSLYRIRLINGGSTFGLKFSIDDQLLEVIASDGIPLEKSLLVHEILLGLGERYDLLINVTGSTSRTLYFFDFMPLNDHCI
jgi:FtsP/CotA-like multicopper oxidase with cupredoxin domain